MEDHPLYGKRKKKKEVIANPLFVEWLTEWKEEAAEKGWKSQYTYGKALTTLKKFPLSLGSGKDCKILENFGDKICKMLDDKLAQHVATYGTTAPVALTNTVTDVKHTNGLGNSNKMNTSASQRENSLTSKPNGKHQRQNSQENIAVRGDLVGGNQNVPRGQRAHELSDSSGDETEQPARKRQRSGRKSGDREYVPTYRSGPYAILLTLYRDMQSDNSRGFMTKAELIRAAQPLADKSFSIPDPGCRYTSWSSMGTLIKKGLVIKESSPAKYSLTDAGCELAHRLEAVKGGNLGDDDDIPFRIHQPPPPGARGDSPPRLLQHPPAQRPGMPKLPTSPGVVRKETPRLPELPNFDDDDESGDDRNVFLGVNGVPSNSGPSDSVRLRHWYVTDDGQKVTEKDKAMVTIDDEISIGFLVKCKYTDLLGSGLRYKLDTSRPLGDDYVYAYLHNDDAPDTATPPPTIVPLRRNDKQPQDTSKDSGQNTKKKKASSSETTKPKKSSKSNKAPEPQLHPLIQELENNTDSRTVTKPSNTETQSDYGQNEPFVIDSEESSLDSLPGIGLKSRVLNKMVKLSSVIDREKSLDPRQSSKELTSSQSSVESDRNYEVPKKKNTSSASPIKCASSAKSLTGGINSIFSVPKNIMRTDSQDSNSQESSQNSIQSLSSIHSVDSVKSFPKPDFVLHPGEFDIVLCVDNAEYYGAGKGSCKTLLPDLIKNGIDCDLRKLHVGDLLWVAREKVRPLPGQLEKPKGRELVLDYIIERKRMDDLVGSCIDGRFKEQKFRLKKCGLRFPMYLIEDYGSMQHFSIPEKTIKQAITNTQVIDGFQVKRTKDSKETVAFLTVMTRYLQSSFREKTLYASSLEDFKEYSQTYNINDSEQRLVLFEEFNQGSVKTKALTVQEMFGKQLIQLHGMSAEKARAVIDLYPTPTHLFAAYDRCSTEISKESLLSNIKVGKASRNLGIAQSKQVYQLYCTKTALK